MRKGTGVNTTPKTRQNNNLGGWLRRRSVRVGLVGLLAAGLVVTTYAMWFRENDRSASATAQVQRGPLVISIAESGTIQNRERAVVKSQVEGTATILYLIAEGVTVKKGDLLVELDSSRLQDDKTQQEITVMNSQAAFIRAQENLAVTKSQADSDIAKADLTYKFAQQDLTKYTEGEHLRELQKADADISIAKEELQRAEDKLAWSKRLAEEGYITRTELQADELSAKRAQIDLDLANSAKDLLDRYTHQRNLDQLRSDVDQAKEALERTKRKAAADLIQAEAELKAKQSEYERQKAKLEKVDDQIAKCKIAAPVGGMVVYATTGQRSFRGNAEPLEEGQQIRERQELIYLPTDAAMTAEIKIHEASLRKVRRGMPVRVTADAVPGKVFWGRVGKIGLLPDANSAWLNPDLKVYSTQIEIEGEATGLRPGMSCRTEIIVEQYADATFVPVQSVVRVGGKSVVYVLGPQGPEAREVDVGLDNNRMIRIVKGLADGQQVLLAPPLAPSAVGEESGKGAELVEVPQAATSPAGAAGPTTAAGATSQPALDPSRLREMSPEERRRFFENLTPEQREQLRSRRPGQGQGPGGGEGRRQRPRPAEEP